MDEESVVYLTDEIAQVIVSSVTESRVEITDISQSNITVVTNPESMIGDSDETVTIENVLPVESTIEVSPQETVTLETTSAGEINVVTVGSPGPPGPRGLQGDQGEIGPEGPPGIPSAVRITSTGVFGGHRVISHHGNEIVYADANNESVFGVIGVLLNSVIPGEEMNIAINGIIEYPPGGLSVNDIIFLSSDGLITVEPTQTKYLRKIGVAVSENKILLDIGEIYTIG